LPSSIPHEKAVEIYVGALKNTHGLEQQTLAMLDNQIERLEHYGDLHALLRRHRAETGEQLKRLEAALAAHKEEPSGFKDSVMGIMGEIPVLTHAATEDEVLKNLFATHSIEHYEIVAYESLIEMARAAGHAETAPFEASLAEEERFAAELRPLVADVTRRYVGMAATGAAEASR
jgi:ferritin-like metal-binding protein YciE